MLVHIMNLSNLIINYVGLGLYIVEDTTPSQLMVADMDDNLFTKIGLL